MPLPDNISLRNVSRSIMKKVGIHSVVIVAALAVLAGAASFAARSSRGQSPSPKSDQLVKPTVLRSESAGKSASPAFATAAGKNSVLENELSWTFGGKPQTGWYLYHSLIGQFLKTRNDASATDSLLTSQPGKSRRD